MAFPAFLDTCVLYPAYLSDTLLRLAEAETYRPLWSADVLAELRRNLIEQGIDADKVDYRMGQMRQVFPSAVVTGYESLISAMTNHPKDRHVLAAAVRANAEVVVTFNTRDFGEEAPDTPSRCYTSKAASYRREPTTVAGVLVRLEQSGVPRFAADLRRHLR